MDSVTTTTSPFTTFDHNAVGQLSPEYRDLVETASLDWQVAEYVRAERDIPFHSSAEVKCRAIAALARLQHGDVFDAAVLVY